MPDISKVILNGVTLMDVTQDTVGPDNLLLNETATMNNGTRTVGTVDLSSISNPNLLENWYFKGGGGVGSFPINQRGGNGYTGASIYTIDRWGTNVVGGEVNIVDASGVTFVLDSAGKLIFQKLSTPKAELYGKTVTISALTTGGDLYTATGTLPASDPGSTTNYASVHIPHCGDFLMLYAGSISDFVCGFNYNSSYSTSPYVTIAAVKLEFGSRSTLCHNEGTVGSPVWVLNDYPNYTEELAKCQRYLLVINTDLADTYAFIAFANGGANGGVVIIPTPVTMNTVTSVTRTGTLVLNDRTANTQLSVTGFTAIRTTQTAVSFVAVATGVVSGRLYEFAIWNDSSGELVISAE